MPDISITFNENEQSVLNTLLDGGVRYLGLQSASAAGHFAQKLADAQKASTQATQASNAVNLPASADSEAPK